MMQGYFDKTISKATAETPIANEGTVSFTLPKDIAQKICGEGYYAYILAESVNNGNKTDYASTPLNIIIPHGHYFSYAAGTGDDAGYIIGTCINEGCNLTGKKAKLTIDVPELNIYKGTGNENATLAWFDTSNQPIEVSVPLNDVYYTGVYGTDYPSNIVAPVSAGEYNAGITCGKVTIGVVYEIKQREVTVSKIKAKDRAYNGTKEAGLDFSDAVLTGVVEADKAKIGISASGEFTDEKVGKNKTVNISNLVLTDKAGSGSGSVIGNYILAATDQQTEASAEIYKADSKISEKPVAKTGLVYTGDNLELITKGMAENGTLVYALTEKGAAAPTDDKYSADIPTSVNAGEYTVYYKVKGDTNYNDVAVANIDVVIKRASQKAPQLTSTDETVSGKNDGTITGLTKAMEISTEGADKGFSAVTYISGNGFAPGTYYVRFAEDKNYEISPVTTIAIHSGTKPVTPTPEPVQEQKQYPYSIKTVVNNPDGSITTTTTTYFEDGSITELIEREWVKGKKKDRKNTKETVTDPEGKTVSTTIETISFSKKGTKTETKDIKKANGYSYSSTVKTYKSGKQVAKVSKTLESGVKQEYTETKNPDGTKTRKVMDTNAKGKSTLTVTAVAWGEADSAGTSDNNGAFGTETKQKLIKTVTKYKVTGEGKIRLTSLKTECDTAIIPKTISFGGKKYMVVALGKKLFKKAEGIKEIYIYAENLKKIYAGAFNGVPADAKFYIKASTTNCKKIVRMIKKSGFGKVDYTKL